MFRQFLHDLRKIDRGKEIPPREVRKKIHLFFMFLPIWQNGRFDNSMPWGFKHVIFGTHGRWVVRKVELTELEEARIGRGISGGGVPQGALILLVVWGIRFRGYRNRNFLQTEHLEDEEQTIRV